MSDIWPYLPYTGNFAAFPLRDTGNHTYGSLWLYTGPTRTLPTDVPAARGHAYPPDPGNHSSFPDEFAWLANQIGNALYDMNRALAYLHTTTMNGGTPDQGQMSIYAARANRILGALGNPLNDVPFWPLVPANSSGNTVYQGYTIKPNEPGPALVSDVNAPNSAFGGSGTALDFSVRIGGDNNQTANGTVIFYQDCWWDNVAPSSTSAWMSWGFILSFALQLIEPATGQARNRKVRTALTTTSSSSSSSYAASSAMPLP